MDHQSRYDSFREMKSSLYAEYRIPPEFELFFRKKILPKLEFTGKKIKQKKQIALHAIHCLVLTGLPGRVVADTRDRNRPGARLRSEVWDLLDAAGFAKPRKGSELSRSTTRYRATERLLDLRREWELRDLVVGELSRNTATRTNPAKAALVNLHSGKFDPDTGELLPIEERNKQISLMKAVEASAQRGEDGKPHPQAVKHGLEYFRAVEDFLEAWNAMILEHRWTAFRVDEVTERRRILPVDPRLHQIHVGEFFRATRLYTFGELGAQNLPKAIRRTITIDGEETAELDFSGMATRMLYHWMKLDPPGDVYRPSAIFPEFHARSKSKRKWKIVRNFVKKCTNICWNVDSRNTAHSSIGMEMAKGEHADFIGNIAQRDGLTPSDIVDRLMSTHAPLEEFFFSRIGIELMTYDGKIMLHILRRFLDAKKPAVGIHDAIRCRSSDIEFAEQTMKQVYREFFLFDPVIR